MLQANFRESNVNTLNVAQPGREGYRPYFPEEGKGYLLTVTGQDPVFYVYVSVTSLAPYCVPQYHSGPHSSASPGGECGFVNHRQTGHPAAPSPQPPSQTLTQLLHPGSPAALAVSHPIPYKMRFCFTGGRQLSVTS